MHRYLLPLTVAAFMLPAAAQTSPRPADPHGENAARASREAQENQAGVLTLAQALDLALAANPELAAARQEVAASEGAVMQAGTLPNPSVEIAVEDTRRETRESTFLLSQPIELGGKRAARVQAAHKGQALAEAQLLAAQAELRAGVIAAFFEVLAAQERLRLSQDLLDVAQRSTEIAARRVAAGKVSPVEETKAQVAQANVRLELAQAKSELATARRRLGATWGEPAPRFSKVDGELARLPELPDTDLLAQGADASPALAQARLEAERRRALAQLEQKRAIPDVSLGVGVKRVEELGGRNQAVLRISMPLPLFDRNQGNVLESLRRADKAHDELSAATVRMQQDLAQAHEKLAIARQEAQMLGDEILPGAQSAYQAALKGFEFGKFGFLDVLDAQRTLLQAHSQHLRALGEAHRAAAEIERLLGQPLTRTHR